MVREKQKKFYVSREFGEIFIPTLLFALHCKIKVRIVNETMLSNSRSQSRKFLNYIVTRAFETGKGAYLLFPKREEKEEGRERNRRT